MAAASTSWQHRSEADGFDEKVGSDEDYCDGRVDPTDDDEEKDLEGYNSLRSQGTQVERSGSSSAVHEEATAEYGHADVSSDATVDASCSRLGSQDGQRLLGAFLLAAEGGLQGGTGRNEGGVEEEPQLPSDGPTCLQKFTTVAASLGLKITREQLREDFEEIVRSNGLVVENSSRPWGGAHDPDGIIRGFTYAVFKRYYLVKIQGDLQETDIRQAWQDLHYGTGGKQMPGSRGGSSGRPYIARAELQKILTREGEALTDEEVDELLRECRPDDEGRIVYEGYRRMLIDPSL